MRNKGNYNNKEKKIKYLEDYEHCIGSGKQAPDFEGTTKLIINYIQENFDSSRDITEDFRALNALDTDLWRPTMQVSEAKDEAVRDRESM